MALVSDLKWVRRHDAISLAVAAQLGAFAVLLGLAQRVLRLTTLVHLMRRMSASRLCAWYPITGAHVSRARTLQLAGSVSRRVRGNGDCLPAALLRLWLLSTGGLHPTLVLGVPKSHPNTFAAHAWLELDGLPVSESLAAVDQFAVIARY